MNRIKLIFSCIVVFFFVQLSASEKHVIGYIGGKGAGFCFSFVSALVHLGVCKEKNLIPVIYWSSLSPYYVDKGNKNDNVWEYYFEPVSNLSFQQGDIVHWKPRFPGGPFIGFDIQDYSRNFNNDFRKYMNSVIQKYVKVKKHIVNKIEFFFEKYMRGKKILGVHVRRTNKITESPLFDINVFLKKASSYVNKGYYIFIASDEHAVVEKFTKQFPGRVIFYNSHRSFDSSPNYHPDYHGRDRKDPLNAILGEEILIETILLSKCDLFLHSYTNVATAVLFFNPILKNIYLDPRNIS